MQAVILAAGKGSRLHPITTSRSKAMLPILGRPIVERVMLDLETNGIHDFILVVSKDDRYISRYFRHDSDIQSDVRFVYQPERLGMANALSYAAPLIEEDFILSACDNLVPESHINELIEKWNQDKQLNGILTLMHVNPDQIPSSGIVEFENNWIKRIVEKPKIDDAPSDIASLPLYVFRKWFIDLLPYVPLSKRGEYELQDAIQMLIEQKGFVFGINVSSRLTLTKPTDLLNINRHYLITGNNRPQLQPQTVGANTRLITPLHIERDVIIGDNCTIGPNVYIERECQIGANSVIRNAILLRETQVKEGSFLEDAVISD
jgi:UDP-N-acetylglucosamine diphosphorylase / glucose-1-phosphate thymidylyltransferase / UDP-N-acetylgalactosamine diphosphorylase / glucosamine-1-phosphate N-acetyltransferase / galactosamine-1-phosphate N-acetyltransferase